MTNGASGLTNTRRLLLIGAAVLLLIGAVVALLVLPAGGGGTLPSASGESEPDDGKTPAPEEALPEKKDASSEPALGGFRASGPTFRSLDEMVATVDLVAIGTVTEVTSREVGDPATPEKEMFLRTVVSVDEVLKGATPESPIVVDTPELAYAQPHTEWRRPGERVLLFLSRGPEAPGFFPTSHSQSVYVHQSGDLRPTVHGPLSERIASLSVEELRQQVQEAKAKIARGEVEPRQGPGIP